MQQNVFKQALYERRREAAIRYSRTDKSDPFAFSRAVSHINGGVVSTRTDRINGKAVETHCLYDADTYPATNDIDPRWAPIAHLGTIKQVQGTSYRNICRP